MNLEGFIKVEKKYDLLNANVDGYYFWVYLRAELAWAYEKKQEHLMEAHEQEHEKIGNRLKCEGKRIINILKKSRIPKGRCDLLVLNHPRRVLVDKWYECIYTDSIVEQIENAVVLEEPYQNIHYTPARTKKMVYTDIVDWNSYVYCVVQRYFHSDRYQKNKEEMLRAIRKPIEELNQIYGVDIKEEQFGDTLIFGFCMYKAEKAYYSKVIRKLRPKVIMEVVSYNRKCMVVNEIAADMKIPTIELQHGTIGEEHIAYNYLPNHYVKQFPIYIFVFSDYWKNKAKFPIKEENIIAVGYPYLEKMAEKFQKKRYANDNRKTILFLSSGPIGDKLSKIAIDLEEILDPQKYHIIFKLHPGEYARWRERYPSLQNTNIEVVDNNKINLYELYSISSIQVSGYNSTTVFEGLYFSLKTYILDYCVAKEIDELCTEGIAHYFKTAEELAGKIVSIEESNENVKEVLWKKDSIQNVLVELKNIMDK